MMLNVLVILFTISCALYVYFYERITKKQIFIFKAITSFLFLLIGIYVYLRDVRTHSYDVFILIGVCCGFSGDILLGFRNLFTKHKNLFFIIGITFFMAGHIAYINAMFTHFHSKVIYLVISTLASYISITLITYYTKVKFGKLTIPCHLYSLISGIFLSVGVLNILRIDHHYVYIMLMGVVSFVTSDVLLSYLYFGNLSKTQRKIFKRINIATYYLGQLILALSIFIL